MGVALLVLALGIAPVPAEAAAVARTLLRCQETIAKPAVLTGFFV